MIATAAWAASHPYYWLFGLPALSALSAGVLWPALSGLPPGRRRSWLYAVFALGMALLFAVLASAVMQDGSLVGFDMALADALTHSMPGSLLAGLSWFTHLGDRYWLAAVAVAMMAGLAWRRQWALVAGAMAASAGGGLLNRFLKHFFQRVRPEHDHGYTEATGFSFPSGHASASLLVYGFACYLLLRSVPARWHMPAVAVTAALVMGIGVSRILLHVHFFSDVLAGFAISALWLAMCVSLTERMLAAPTHRS